MRPTALIPILALLVLPAAAQAEDAVRPVASVAEGCAQGIPASECAARREIEAAARCALGTSRTASADDASSIPDPSRILSDRKEALRLLNEGEEDEALVIARGMRSLSASCN